MKRSLLSFIIALQVFGCSAQSINPNKLDSFFAQLDQYQKFMGSVAVSQNGKILYTKSVGFSDVAAKAPLDINSKFRIGSISKTFTAVLTMKAKEEGRLSLDETIGKYFPAVKNADKITIRHLLSHRSGIHNFTDDSSFQTWFTKPHSRAEMIDIVTKAQSDFEPGTKVSYSNSAFVLLSCLLEKVYKKSYASLIEGYITRPLGLHNTYVGDKIKTEVHEVRSYKYAGGWKLEPETDMSIPLGAGAIVSTPSDLLIFAEALFNGKLVSSSSVDEMKTLKDNIGLGLFRFPFYDHYSYGHTGGIDGFTSMFLYDPEAKIGYAMVSNGSNYNNNNITIAVLSAAYNKPYDIPIFSTYAVSSDDLDKYLGTYGSTEIPLKMTFIKEGNKLKAEVAGQGTKSLEALAKDKFGDDQAGVVIVFDPASNSFVFTQGGRSFRFTRNEK
jgi:D-alanyl-D-alanine carboxypeptidase